MEENLMDIKQTSEYLQMNKMTVYKLAREGRIPAFKVASEWRFSKDLINKWLMGQLKDKPGSQKLKFEKEQQARKTILVVDDDEMIQDFFVRALTEYNILVASDGEEAVDIAAKKRPALILLDIKMPGIDGIETLRRIKEIDNNIAVVMLSAHGTLKANLEAARLGAYTSMAKPFDLGEIKTTIKSAIISPAKTDEVKPDVTTKKTNRKDDI